MYYDTDPPPFDPFYCDCCQKTYQEGEIWLPDDVRECDECRHDICHKCIVRDENWKYCKKCYETVEIKMILNELKI